MNNTIYINPSKHGSLQNAIYDQTKSLKPEIGIGVTEIMFSDRHPYTITAILSPKRIQVKPDIVKRIDKNGFSEGQEYEYITDEKAEPITLFLNKFGRWKQLGNSQGSTFLIGKREEYYDFTR